MNKRKDGGDAFPRCYEYEDGEYVNVTGMSLRDYFAAKAMQTIIEKLHAPEDIARRSYAIADQMIKARGEV
jgi:hypothetical protein